MKKKALTIVCAAVMMSAAAAACGGTTKPAETTAAESMAETMAETMAEESKTADGAAAPGEAAGFTEIPIFEDMKADFLNVSAVYFQPVPMAPGQENVEDFNMHLECDVSALENDLGYGVGDWVPYLTIDFKLIGSDGKEAAAGTFMEMSASDGPHYGANISLPNADTYTVEFTIHSPAENGYLIHSDAETGPGGVLEDHFKDGNLVVTYEGWDYTPQEW